MFEILSHGTADCWTRTHQLARAMLSGMELQANFPAALFSPGNM